MPYLIRREDGFTLIEIMVVIFIIGISVMGVSLMIGGDSADAQLRSHAQRFATLGEFASERAILSGKPVGLLLEPPSWRDDVDASFDRTWRYRWQRMTDEGWQDEPGLDAEELPTTVQLDVTVEGQMWEWDDAPEVRLPVAVFYPSGEVTQFTIELRDERVPDFAQHVEVNDWGEVVWRERPGAEQDANDRFR